jgi:DNA repair exonuclease SbcCD ATPase subunit
MTLPITDANPTASGQPQGEGQGQSNQQPAGSTTNWEEAYKKQQSLLQKANEEREAALKLINDRTLERDTALGKVHELLTEKTTISAQLNELTGARTNLEEKAKGLEGKVNELQTEAERWKMIAKDYPHLITYEVEGLLPKEAASLDELRAKLDSFAKLTGQVQHTQETRQKEGSTPSSPATTPNQAVNDDELYQQAIEANQRGDREEYNRLMEKIRQTAKVPKSYTSVV